MVVCVGGGCGRGREIGLVSQVFQLEGGALERVVCVYAGCAVGEALANESRPSHSCFGRRVERGACEQQRVGGAGW